MNGDWYCYVNGTHAVLHMAPTEELAIEWCRQQMRLWLACGFAVPEYRVQYNRAGEPAKPVTLDS